jgi:hypothetical protein
VCGEDGVAAYAVVAMHSLAQMTFSVKKFDLSKLVTLLCQLVDG